MNFARWACEYSKLSNSKPIIPVFDLVNESNSIYSKLFGMNRIHSQVLNNWHEVQISHTTVFSHNCFSNGTRSDRRTACCANWSVQKGGFSTAMWTICVAAFIMLVYGLHGCMPLQGSARLAYPDIMPDLGSCGPNSHPSHQLRFCVVVFSRKDNFPMHVT